MWIRSGYFFRGIVAAGLMAFATECRAVPYASQVRDLGDGTWEFVLNEPADSISILRDGGNVLDLVAPSSGRHTFDMTGFTDFSIQVSKNAPAEWTQTSDPDNLHTAFFRPVGVAINQDASSPYFGTIYVSHPVAVPPAGVVPVGAPRAMGLGIYALSGDQIAVDLANNFSAFTDPEDTTAAKAPANWTISNNSGSSPWRLALDDSNNLIVADFSDQNGGIWYATPDLTTGDALLATSQELGELPDTNGVIPLPINNLGQEVHGSILSKPNVTGSVGSNLKVWAIDEDYDLDGDTFNVAPGEEFAQTSTFHPLRWDIGAATHYDGAPTVVINKEVISDIVDDDMGTPDDTSDDFNDTAYTASPESIGGVIVNNLHYEPQFDKFYITQSRTHGNESGIFIVTADGVDGNSPTVNWSSKRFSFDNGLDGNNTVYVTPDDAAYGEGIQDIFRNIDDIVISPDGKTMFVSRLRQFGPDDFDQDPTVAVDGDNPVLGLDSNAPGAILAIPLDENGLPDLLIDDNDTPNDTSDDFISNIQSIPMTAPGRTIRGQIAVDAAGNVYSVDNLSERLQIFSPGGNTLAITGSDGTFSLGTPTAGTTGDYNGDGIVNIADYTVFRNWLGGDSSVLKNNEIPGPITVAHYQQWKSNFGQMAAAGAVVQPAKVPEPSTLLVVVSLLGMAGAAKCNRKQSGE